MKTICGGEIAAVRLKAFRIAGLVIVPVWCAFWLAWLMFQSGNIWDESEHAHVAWLMSQGKRPLDDFFQHHQPLLWDLLSIYYRVGFGGAGVLIWGRILVVLCALVVVWALLRLGRPSSRGSARAGLAGVAIFMALTLLLGGLFVSRPETLSAACMLAALAMWYRGDRFWELRILAAGVLAGAAVYASPRFVLLGGYFLLLGGNTFRRWALLVTGGILFVSTYTLVSGFSLEKVLFDIRFSAHLQSVSDRAVGLSPEFWILLLAVTLLSMFLMLLAVGSENRLRGELVIANLLVIFLVCHEAAGLCRYEQAYAPFIVGVPLALSWLIARTRPASSGRACSGVIAGTAVLVVAGSVFALEMDPLEFRILDIVKTKDELAARVPAGKTVLLYTYGHPITVPDASYYGTPLYDAKDRLCRAISSFHSPIILPSCDYFRDLQSARPYLVDGEIIRAVNIADMAALDRWLGENYAYLELPSAVPPSLGLSVLVYTGDDSGG